MRLRPTGSQERRRPEMGGGGVAVGGAGDHVEKIRLQIHGRAIDGHGAAGAGFKVAADRGHGVGIETLDQEAHGVGSAQQIGYATLGLHAAGMEDGDAVADILDIGQQV